MCCASCLLLWEAELQLLPGFLLRLLLRLVNELPLRLGRGFARHAAIAGRFLRDGYVGRRVRLCVALHAHRARSAPRRRGTATDVLHRILLKRLTSGRLEGVDRR